MGFFSSVWKAVKAPSAALISGIGQVAGGIINSVTNAKAQEKANQANMELAKYQNDRNMELWNMQNAYNTPQAQMQRYEQAGLNPNLIYGQGSSGNAAAPEQTQVPSIQPYTGFNAGIGDAVTTALHAQAQQSAIELQQTQADANRLGMISETLRQANQVTKNAQDQFSYDMAVSLQQNTLDVAAQNLANLRAQEQAQISTSNLNAARAVLTEHQAALSTVQMRQALKAIDKLEQDMRIAESRLSLDQQAVYQRMAIERFKHDMNRLGIDSPGWSRASNEILEIVKGIVGVAARGAFR
ncbi:DNA pilot protein [Peromfec virus RodF8_52]|uniref:DNA pilot protein n=1 Tax=Peromfec virus RodF8_52 TaxID=2929381 RepID=A0A976R5H1_9VIRU|nr:DNA pilot protein [Peromfec virus RodF8_52]